MINLFEAVKGWSSEDDEQDESVRAEIDLLLVELRSLKDSTDGLSRLHEIEKMMVDDVLKENRHLNCRGCVRWMTALVKKAKGEEWQ